MLLVHCNIPVVSPSISSSWTPKYTKISYDICVVLHTILSTWIRVPSIWQYLGYQLPGELSLRRTYLNTLGYVFFIPFINACLGGIYLYNYVCIYIYIQIISICIHIYIWLYKFCSYVQDDNYGGFLKCGIPKTTGFNTILWFIVLDDKMGYPHFRTLRYMIVYNCIHILGGSTHLVSGFVFPSEISGLTLLILFNLHNTYTYI
jgi:hypothetical protein